MWAGAALGALLIAPWAASLSSLLWACSFKAVTGYACPTCGTARAAVALSQMHVVDAFVRFPLPTLGWFVFLGGGIVALGMALAGKALPALPRPVPLWARWGFVAVVILNWAYSIATGV